MGNNGKQKPKVMVAMPTGYDKPIVGAARAVFLWPSSRYPLMHVTTGGSALCRSFNVLWSTALAHTKGHGTRGNRMGLTHFAMLHDDIEPSRDWVDCLMDEMTVTGADVVSAVSPIKDRRGVSSTAIGRPGDKWNQRRLTFKELGQLPETFTIETLRKAGLADDDDCLLVNTGCFLANLLIPQWFQQDKPGEVFCFRMVDRLLIDAKGDYTVDFAPEDWNFSRWCALHGVKLAATRKVRIRHFGNFAYPNVPEAWTENPHALDVDQVSAMQEIPYQERTPI